MFRSVTQACRALVLVALGAALCVWIGLRSTVTTVDRNSDGRIDVWEYHDGPFGALSQVVEDRNFDGRPDRISSFVGGTLRRRSDTSFDGRVHQVDEFDGDGNATRTVRDTDDDGIADLLVLYRDGVPVYAQRASASALAANLSSHHGIPLSDPFERERTVRRDTRKDATPTGLGLHSKLYILALTRASPSGGNSLGVFIPLETGSQFDPGTLFARGPPAFDPALL
jgi:hypothetical protein